MNSKEFLEQLPAARTRLDFMKKDISQRRSMLGTLSSTPFDREFVTGSKHVDDSSEVMELARIMEKERYLKDFEALVLELKIQVQNMIDDIADDKYQSVLRFYYVYGLSQEQVANRLFISRRTVNRWMNDAYDLCLLPFEPVVLPL